MKRLQVAFLFLFFLLEFQFRPSYKKHTKNKRNVVGYNICIYIAGITADRHNTPASQARGAAAAGYITLNGPSHLTTLTWKVEGCALVNSFSENECTLGFLMKVRHPDNKSNSYQ